MGKRKINAKELVNDLKTGLSEKELMAKHKVSGDGLKTLLKKLMDAGMLTQEDLGARKKAQAQRKASQQAPAPTTQTNPQADYQPPSAPTEQPEPMATPQTVDQETALAIAEQIKNGAHDNAIMGKFELSPGKLKAVKEELAQLGYLPQPEPEPQAQELAAPAVCPSCGVAAEPGDQTCVYCGAQMDTPTQGPALTHGFREPGSADDDDDYEDEKNCPWEDRESYGTINAFIQTASNCLFNPSYFFSHLPIDKGMVNPILFSIFSMLTGILFSYVWTSLYYGTGGIFYFFLAIPFIMVIGGISIAIFLFIWGGLVHLALTIAGGAKEGFEATFRSVSYSSVTQVFNAIPVIGSIASLWGLVLTVIGLRETHKTSTGKSILAVVLPLIMVILISIGVYIKAKQMIVSMLLGQMGANQEFTISPSESSGPLPDEICEALNNFLLEVDLAVDSGDPDEAKGQIQRALRDLAEAAQPYSQERDVQQVVSRAGFYAAMAMAEAQGQSVPGGMAEQGREALEGLCEY